MYVCIISLYASVRNAECMKEHLVCHASAAAPSVLPDVLHNSNFIEWDIAYDVYRVPMAIIPR